MSRGPSRGSPTTRAIDGLLLVDKPSGVTSHDVVAIARRALGVQRVGHAGTLDPFATGLLLMLFGSATRLAQFLNDEPKEYEATLRFGVETDTGDVDGRPVRQAPIPSRAALEAAAAPLIGPSMQVPPAYSARRVGGERAYRLARAGKEVALPPTPIVVHALRLDRFAPGEGGVASCRMLVTCSGGTYVRALARDLACAAGSAAHLDALRRLRAGVFSLNDAADLESVRAGRAVLRSSLAALEGHAVQELAADEARLVLHGRSAAARVQGPFAALVTGAGADAPRLVAFAERNAGPHGDEWQPRVVLDDA